MNQSHTDVVVATPPISVGVLQLFGVPLNEWVILGSFVLMVFLIIEKLPIMYGIFVNLYRKLRGKNGRN